MKNIILALCLSPSVLIGQSLADQLPEIHNPSSSDAMVTLRGCGLFKTTLSSLETYFTSGSLDSVYMSNDTLFARTKGSTYFVSLSEYAKKSEVPELTSDLINDSGFLTAEMDGSSINEIQTISIDGTNLTLSLGGGTVPLPTPGSSSYFNTVAELEAVDLDVNSIAITKGFNYVDDGGSLTYLIQADSVPGYATDQKYVVLLQNGNYAVANLSSRRSFSTYDELGKLGPLLKFSGEVETVAVGGKNVVVSASPLRISDFDLDETTDTIVDGLFLDTIRSPYSGENLYANSSDFTWPGGSAPLAKIENLGIGIDGEAVNGVTLGVGTEAILGSYKPVIGAGPARLVTLSYYLKPHNVSGNTITATADHENGNNPLDSLVIDLTATEYKRYAHVINYDRLNSRFFRLRFNGITQSDTLLIDGVQIEYGTSATPLKKTSGLPADSDLIYVNRGYSSIENGVLDASYFVRSVKNSDRTLQSIDHTPLLQSLNNYCGGVGEGGENRCSEILLERGKYRLAQEFFGVDGVIMRGPHTKFPYANSARQSFGTALMIDKKGGTAFNYSPTVDNVIQNSGLHNVNLVITDTLDVVISAGKNWNCSYRNIGIYTEAIDVSNPGKYDIAIIDALDDDTPDHLYNEWDDIEIRGADSIAIITEKGNTSNWRNIHVGGAQIGVYVLNGIDMVNATIEGCSQAAVYHVGGSSYIRELYTESNGFNGDSTSAIVHMEGGNLFLQQITNNYSENGAVIRMNGGGLTLGNFPSLNGGTQDGYFDIKDTSAVSFLRIMNSTAGAGAAWRVRGDVSKFKCEDCNGIDWNGTDGYSNYSVEAQNISQQATNLLIDGDLKFSQINLTGEYNQNIILNSRDLFTADTIQGIITKPNSFVSPFGDTTACVIDYSGPGVTTSVSNFAWRSNILMGEDIDDGDEFILSYSLYLFGDLAPRNLFALRMGGDASSLVSVTTPNIGQGRWVRMHHRLKREGTNGITDRFNLRLFGPGNDVDSIAVWNMQISKAKRAGGAVVTTGSAVLSQQPSLIGDLEIDGDLIITGELITPSWRPVQYTATEASALTPSNGDLIYVTSVNSTFACIGFWGYQGGRWVKL